MNSKKLKIIAAAIPIIMSILVLMNNIIFFIIHIQTVKALSNEPETEKLVKIIEQNLNYNDYSSITTIIGLFAIVVSVWVSLSIYNIIEKKNVEKTEEKLKYISKQVVEFQNDYSAFNIQSLGYIKVWEDRINNFYVEKISEIIKGTSYPLYQIATSMVRIENLLTTIVDWFTQNAYYQMKEYLELYLKEINLFSKKINSLCEKHIKSNESMDILHSYINCRLGEYYYYLYFREKYIGKPNAYNILMEACEKFETAINLCPEGNKYSNGYIDNALAFLYFKAFEYNKILKKEEADKYIELAYESAKKAVSFDSHYYRNYRNYGVILENYSSYTNNIDYSEALKIAYNQYEKAFECNPGDYNTLISLASCLLKQIDLKIGLGKRNKKDQFPIFKLDINISEDEMYKIKRNYDYLLQASQINVLDERAHYHLIHTLMYLYLLKNQYDNIIPFSKEEIIRKAKSEVEICETIYFKREEKEQVAYLFKSRNFFESINDLKKAHLYNDRILTVGKIGDSDYWDNQYKKYLV